jgi:predicted HTH domain antitoxin
MTIEVPEEQLGSLRLTPNEARLEFAMGLYSGRLVSIGRAAKISGMPYIAFMKEAGGRGIPMNYTMEDAEHDMAMVETLTGRV